MLPLIFEGRRRFQDGVTGSPGESDMCLLLGLALPRYLGGALKYADGLAVDHCRALHQVARPRRDLPAERPEIFGESCGGGKGFYAGVRVPLTPAIGSLTS